jgi:hypothetical protein
MAYSMMALLPLTQIIDSMTGLLEGDPVSPYQIEAKLRKHLILVGACG